MLLSYFKYKFSEKHKNQKSIYLSPTECIVYISGKNTLLEE